MMEPSTLIDNAEKVADLLAQAKQLHDEAIEEARAIEALHESERREAHYITFYMAVVLEISIIMMALGYSFKDVVGMHGVLHFMAMIVLLTNWFLIQLKRWAEKEAE